MLREKGLKAELTCSYSIKWFAKHPEYADVLEDPEKEKQKADMLNTCTSGNTRSRCWNLALRFR